ncbi:MAG: diguanylate cyclase [Desulfohalobiaceae bacterium]|nr:diguanylate cyclase [Desulfohalobiaceae bacterium]
MTDKASILVVDDERTNRKVLSDLLKENYQVLPAKNGEQALQRLQNDTDIDLVLLDVMMPDMDGYEVLRRMKAEEGTKDIPVIFITALDSAHDEEKGLRLGAADYITKPFHSAIVLARVENHLRFVRQRKLLESLAGRDGLTEIPNRRSFNDFLKREWQRCRRNEQPLSLAMVDVDFFKPYNDNYGHAAGDRVLKEVAWALTSVLNRPADMVARYGGEEFALLFPETKLSGAGNVAERARNAVEQLGIIHEHSPVVEYVTISVGVAGVVPEGEKFEGLVRAADDRLYQAKEEGRNRVA